MASRRQTAQSEPVEIEEWADDEGDRGAMELPHELVGQYVDLGKRRAAVWDTLFEMLSQHLGLGSAEKLDDATREELEEELEELIVEAHEAS